MARRSLLQQSWDDTRERITAHPRATAWSAVAVVLVVLAVAIGVSRSGGDDATKTRVRADESAVSVVTPTTYFGNDVLPNPKKVDGAAVPRQTGVTLRNGDGLHLYTGTIPDYRSGGRPNTTAPAGSGSSPATSAPASGGGGGGPATTAYAPAVFGANRIAYVINGQTWTVNPDGSDARFVANSSYYPAWAPSHSALAVVDGQSPGGILSYITPGGGRYALTPQPEPNEGDSRPSWSPDGVRIAFARIDFQASGGYSSIWVINKDGQNAHRVSVAGCISADPTWSPDGTHIAFWSSRDHCASANDTGSYELYAMNSDGTNLKRLATPVNSGAPSFSPDGSQIAFASDRDGDFDIYVMNADGTGTRQLTSADGEDTDPTWSPDGARIAFRSSQGKGGVYTVKAGDGSDARLVATGGSQPSWS